MKIKEIKINKFRNLENITLPFAAGLNAIAGQNGTSKTSVLGLIGHVFTFDSDEKTLAGKKFYTEFSDIFKFAYPDYDKSGDHSWLTTLDSGKNILATSFDRKETGKKNSIRIRVGKSERGRGKLKLPVIYLGMGRLFPLTLENQVMSNVSVLSHEEIKEFVDLHNEILLIVDEKVEPESITTANKSFYAPKTEKYNHLGNSAGQDNIGQIITALISYRRLRDKLGDEYRGGILLIDELDASLFPAAQIKLIEKLDAKSKELNLQIFFTTHSLEVLLKTLKTKNSNVIYFDKSSGKIEPKSNPTPDELTRDLLVQGPENLKRIYDKKYIYCEDEEAVEMLKNVLPQDIKEKVKIFPTKLGNSMLMEIAKKKIPDFKNSIIILDGDSNPGSIKNVICLPGSFGPDNLIYNFLQSLQLAEFQKIKPGYTKQFCFKDLLSLDSSSDKKRDKLKKWYKTQRMYWGALSRNVWKLWIKNNQKECNDFINKVEKLINI